MIPKPHPYFKSLAFWAWISLAVFFYFAWIDSRRHGRVVFSGTDPGVGVANTDSAFEIAIWTHNDYYGHGGFKLDAWAFGREGAGWFPKARFGLVNFSTVRINLPHWLLLSVWLLGFAAYLGWRGARNRRIGTELALLAGLSAASPPDAEPDPDSHP